MISRVLPISGLGGGSAPPLGIQVSLPPRDVHLRMTTLGLNTSVMVTLGLNTSMTTVTLTSWTSKTVTPL